MNTTQAQQKALDDAPVAPADRQKFEDLLLEHDILSFIRDLGPSIDIIYLSDVSVDYLHQPCRAFATIINKCLSGKETRMDKIRLPIENKEAKKTNKMSYPRFTKIIIDYFMSKDQSILRKNKMFWHTARDDIMFTSMRCVSRHEDTQVYGTILPKDLTNQAMLESKAYKTYYAFASGEKTPKPKYVQKKVDSNTSPKQKPVQATKGTRIKTKAKVAKSDKKKQPAKMPKSKGLNVLSKVALTKAEQLKLVTKRSKTQFHSSHASCLGDGVDTQSNVPDEQHLKTNGADEGTEDEDDENDYEDKSDGNDDDNANDDDNQEGDDMNDDDEETDSDSTESDRIKIHLLNQSSTEYYEEEEEEKIDDEETMDEEEGDEVTKELYDDVNINLGNEDTDMTNADQGASEQQNVSQESWFEQVKEDAHVTLTPVLDTQKVDEPVQSSSVSSDFTSKLLNIENPSLVDNEIASLLDTRARQATAVPEITFSFTTTIPPPPPFFNPLLQQATPTSTPTTFKATTSFTSLPYFSSLFNFNKKVTNLEKYLSEIKQFDQQEAQDEKNEYSSYEVAALLSEFELTKILLDKMEESKSHLRADYKKKLYDALFESYKTKKDLFNTYGEVFALKRSRDDSDKDRDPSVGSDRGTKRRKSSKEAESSKDSRSKEKKSSKDAFQSQHKSSGKSAQAKEPSHIVDDSRVH
ncbi:hypothetical protein Tco_1392870 [Tanacetum coccineum]